MPPGAIPTFSFTSGAMELFEISLHIPFVACIVHTFDEMLAKDPEAHPALHPGAHQQPRGVARGRPAP